ncbi:hypothetical protein FVEN_g13057 [Fusarium venenatum]|nr:hypothetical protein FVEN_g13057 [Fusarium venenatum]
MQHISHPEFLDTSPTFAPKFACRRQGLATSPSITPKNREELLERLDNADKIMDRGLPLCSN